MKKRLGWSSRCQVWIGCIAVLGMVLISASADARVIQANPQNMDSLLSTLKPGDTLVLAPGIYEPLVLSNLNGTPKAWITITGAHSADGTGAAVIAGKACVPGGGRCDVVTIFDSSYLAVKKLRIDGGGGVHSGFGISTMGGVKNHVHDILIEDNVLLGLHASQQNDGISTKSPTWNWTIRGNKIFGAGTALYLGNSTGDDPFVAGVIEDNLVQDPVGYDMEIKRQNPWPKIPGMPTGPTVTIIRNNTFIKGNNPSPDGDRPNVLVDGFPATGPGSRNRYEIYGNFFYHNPRGPLLQVTGKASIHDNVFVGGRDSAKYVATHPDRPGMFSIPGRDAAIFVGEHHHVPVKLVNIYNNTIYTAGVGIFFRTPAEESSTVVGNIIFASTPMSGPIAHKFDNLTGTPEDAKRYLKSPTFLLGQLNLYPLPGRVQGPPLDLSQFARDQDYDLDFNGTPKEKFSGRTTFRGAYAGEGFNPGWKLQAGKRFPIY